MARNVILGGVGKNPSIDALMRVSPGKFSAIARKELDAAVIKAPNDRALALPSGAFSAVVSGAFANETSTNNVIRLMSQRVK